MRFSKKNFPHLLNEVYIQIQEAYRTANRPDKKRGSLRHITIKMPKVINKETILKSARDSETNS